ncbi:unnamed protein product [Adineta ricciae]|uniref:palmitoyl-protein hydrolase n=1 Tax=Adineta ricciae TaxID=249248 RepID=A0A814XUE0_ADIRI|nr:unnamed protein product [Adineta ricciae]CAF1220766.1 unnamed protein product [Adineta ricciae]
MSTPSSMKKLIDTAHIIEPMGTHLHSIIWFHGFGDSSEGCKDIFSQIQPPNTRIVLPNAPKRWHTIQGQQHFVQSWYGEEAATVEHGLPIVKWINELIDGEIELVKDSTQLIIGGFSQGACLALMTGLRFPKLLGGIICCSGHVAYLDRIQEFLGEHARQVPILVLHGKDDDRICWDEVKPGFDLLRQHGLQDNLQIVVEDRVGHIISRRGFNQIIMFFVKQFKL